MDRTDPVSLETLLGDPYDPANPCSEAALAAADERGVACADGERLLDGVGFRAELVPIRWGGRLDDVEQLVRRVRPLFRRDAALGYRYCLAPLAAGSPVWHAGTVTQQRRLADLLLSGGAPAAGIHDLPGDGADTPAGPRLSAGPGHLRVDGRRPLVVDADRADAAVLLAPTAGEPPAGGASVVFVDLGDDPATGIARTPRERLPGLRGCGIGDLVFDGRELGEDELVGPYGAGSGIAASTAPVNACVAAGAGLGMLDAGLFAALRFARQRRLYGQRVADLHHVRSSLAATFCHLLAADALVTAAARALRHAPDLAPVHAAAAHHLAPLLVEEAMNLCSVVLGARFYLRGQEYAGFGRSVRAMPLLALRRPDGPAGRPTILAGLPALLGAPDPALAPLLHTPLAVHVERLAGDAAAPDGGRAVAQRCCVLLAAAAVTEQAPIWAEPTIALLTGLLDGRGGQLADDAAEPVFAELERRAESGTDFFLTGDTVCRTLAG